MYAEVAEAGRLQQLLGSHRNLDTGVGAIARLEALHGIKSRAGTERSEHWFRRRHTGVFAAIFGGLIAKNRMRPRMNGEFNRIEMRNPHLHCVSPLH
jgi:hypothetical protein